MNNVIWHVHGGQSTLTRPINGRLTIHVECVAFLELKLKVTINTDNNTVSNTDIINEYKCNKGIV